MNGSTVNQYAPFYLWATAAGMNDFLLGPGFAGLSNDLGRPAVRHWTGLAFERGPAFDEPPQAAVRNTMWLTPDNDLAAAIQAALDLVPAIHLVGRRAARDRDRRGRL